MTDIFRRILEDKLHREQHIRQFQEVVWHTSDEGPYVEILAALALDLDYIRVGREPGGRKIRASMERIA